MSRGRSTTGDNASAPDQAPARTPTTKRAAARRAPANWESAVVVRVPELERTLSGLREQFDLPRKPNGIPAHVTLIVPFLPATALHAQTLAALQAICAEVSPFEVRFRRTGRFPTVLYLDPEPATAFRDLTLALIKRWPQLEPYAGQHKAVIPHLTITTSRDRALLDRVARATDPLLPISAMVRAAQLFRFDGVRWSEDSVIPLQAPV